MRPTQGELLLGLLLSLLCVTAASASRPVTRLTAPTNPRAYYLGRYGEACHDEDVHHGIDSGVPDLPHRACYTGRGVRVAVLDTGLCAGIAQHSKNNVACTSVVPGVGCDEVGCSHGTRSVSVLAGNLVVPTRHDDEDPAAATYVGLAPHAAVHAFRVFDRQRRTHRRHIARALELLLHDAAAWATGCAGVEKGGEAKVESGSHRGRSNATCLQPPVFQDGPVDVISLSYGSEDYFDSPDVHTSLDRLMHEHGVVVVAAAGNEADSVRFGSVRSPAEMSGVLAVGALHLEPPTPPSQALASDAVPADSNATAAASSFARDSRLLDAPAYDAAAFRRSVAAFSGRGPTTRELPLGAGRVKPDLVALGHRVWSVQGISTAPSVSSARAALEHSASERRKCNGRSRAASSSLLPSSSSSRLLTLQQSTSSGTSIATPIVAGTVALCLEAARAARRTSTGYSTTTCARYSTSNARRCRMERLEDSLHVRAALLRTAAQLPYTPLPLAEAPPPASDHVLAGLPLQQLYTRYLHLSRSSILAQGAGEVQPLRALTAITHEAGVSPGSQQHAPALATAVATCTSFAIPSSVRIGSGVAGAEAEGVGAAATAAAAAYWWPFSDELVYPGAPTPVLFNFSLHLCPSPSSSSSPPFPSSSSSSSSSSPRSLSVRHTIVRVRGHPRVAGTASPSVVVFQPPQRQGGGARRNATSARTQELLRRHLLRVVTELHADRFSPPPSSSASPSGAAPSTSFSLSIAIGTPPSAQTGLCLNTRQNSLFEAGEERRRGREDESGTAAHDCHDDNDKSVRGASSNTTCGGRVAADAEKRLDGMQRTPYPCTPLFDHFDYMDIDGVLHVSASAGDTAAPLVRILTSIRVVAPPSRRRRVLMDTSLDWFNPTSVTSDLFVAGDDPHESAAPTQAAGPSGRQRQRAYAEAAGGDHPHTNLALLTLYLRHTLGMAVHAFPLLHVSGGHTGTRQNKTVAAAHVSDALRSVGTVMVVDPERPLTRTMRHLLRRAVQHDGLFVLLVTDWYTAGGAADDEAKEREVAAQEKASDMTTVNIARHLHWERDSGAAAVAADTGSSARGKAKERARGGTAIRADAGDHAATADTCPSSLSTSSSDTDSILRAWRRLPDGTTRGLAGSCHIPSWNRWLTELTEVLVDHVAQRQVRNTSSTQATAASSDSLDAGQPGPPLQLSESIVLDGTIVVGGSGVRAARTSSSFTQLRSLGQLNAAGVLHWRDAMGSGTVNRSDEPSTEDALTSAGTSWKAGEATLCNVQANWARQQRRLRKRRLADAVVEAQGGQLPPDGMAAVVEDDWAELDGVAGQPASMRIGGRDVLPSPAAEAVASREPHGAASAKAANSGVAHGFLGFLTPPHDPKARASTVGRIAIFTDSDCLSTADYHVQAALDEVEVLLRSHVQSSSTTTTTTTRTAPCRDWACVSRTDVGEQLLRGQTAQSALCVEVVKELLRWGLTEDGHLPWQDAAQLQCETRPWRGSARTSVDDGAVDVKDAAAEQSDELDGFAGTAPERIDAGAATSRLWAEWADACHACHAPLAPLRPASNSDPVNSNDAASADAADEAKTRRALRATYHGDWDLYTLERDAPLDRAAAHPTPSPASRGKRTPAHSSGRLEALLSWREAWESLRWLRHPLVVGQLLTALALLLALCLMGRWHRL